MSAWNSWFKSIANRQVDRGGLRTGRKITQSGTEELNFGKDSLTGYTIIKSESLDEAEEIAKGCPIVSSTIVYEMHK